MSESTTRAYSRESYTIDLSGLIAHTRDTFSLYVSSALDRVTAKARPAMRDMLNDLPDARTGPALLSHERHGIPDNIRVR